LKCSSNGSAVGSTELALTRRAPLRFSLLSVAELPPSARYRHCMTSDAEEAETLKRVDGRIAEVLTADEPYWAAVAVADAASESLVTSNQASHHYRIWMALTDRYELKPDERREAVADMQRAATEWIAANADDAARARWFDQWLYRELGFNRE
jgi:hypothetical protein